jgi:hypothetical protein
MTTPNAELAYKVLDQIDLHPELWDQASWSKGCGTSYCFAGWALTLAGRTLRDYEGDDGIRRMQLDDTREVLSGTVSLAASRELGLTHWDGELLFEPDNTREALGELVAEFFGPRPDPKPSLDRHPVEAAIYDDVAPNAGSES